MTHPGEARVHALVPAAGAGRRMGAALPKQYLSLRGRTLAEHTMARLLSLASIDRVVVAVAADDPWWPTLPPVSHRRVETVTGGDTRAESVRCGLEALLGVAGEHDWVLVHDMARPCVRLSDMERLLASAGEHGALLARPLTDTLKEADDQGFVLGTPDRRRIWRALTPQLFPVTALHRALVEALEAGAAITDEASAMERAGWRPRLVTGRADNIKVTEPADLPLAGFHLQQQEEEGLQWQDSG